MDPPCACEARRHAEMVRRTGMCALRAPPEACLQHPDPDPTQRLTLSSHHSASDLVSPHRLILTEDEERAALPDLYQPSQI